jgi:hypothetical protein
MGNCLPTRSWLIKIFERPNRAGRNVSTTLIHPGSEFKLGYVASIQRLCAGQAVQPFVLAVFG